jgi:hypothetical protein
VYCVYWVLGTAYARTSRFVLPPNLMLRSLTLSCLLPFFSRRRTGLSVIIPQNRKESRYQSFTTSTLSKLSRCRKHCYL